MSNLDLLFDSLIISDCMFILSKNNDGGISLKHYKNENLIHALEQCIKLSLQNEANIIRYELGLRNNADPKELKKLLQGRLYKNE